MKNKLIKFIPNWLLLKFGLFRFGVFIEKVKEINWLIQEGHGRYYKFKMDNSNMLHYLDFNNKDLKLLANYLKNESTKKGN